MNEQTFKSVASEAAYRREVQAVKFTYVYHVSQIIGAATTTPVTLTIEQDADFFITQITGGCYGPVDAVGVQTGGATNFDMPGTAAGFAGKGISMRITDTGAGRDMTNGFVPAELLLSPGYDIQFHIPLSFKYYARRNSKIRFDLRNRDVGSHQVDIALIGYKYMIDETVLDRILTQGK